MLACVRVLFVCDMVSIERDFVGTVSQSVVEGLVTKRREMVKTETKQNSNNGINCLQLL